jgi:hypothetical protein
MNEAETGKKPIPKLPLGAVPIRPLIPYEKRPGLLQDVQVKSEIYVEHTSIPEAGFEEDLKQDVYVLTEIRDGRSIIVEAINIGYSDTWGGAMDLILKEILPALADKTQYRWDEIKKPIIDFWSQRNAQWQAADKAAGGPGTWTLESDFSLRRLMDFVAATLGSKYELLNDVPSDYEAAKKKAPSFEQSITMMAFNEVIARDEIKKIMNLPGDEKQKARSIVDYIVKYVRATHRSGMDLLDPDYRDVASLLAREEKAELDGLFALYEKIEKEIEAKKISNDEKILEKNDFWETDTGKRLNALNSRRVQGGTMAFKDREEKKREVAHRISLRSIVPLLLSWGISWPAAQEGQKEYFALYTAAEWEREQREIEGRKMVKKGAERIESIRDAIRGGWDSNSLTFFGVIIGVAISALLGSIALLLQSLGLFPAILAGIAFTSLLMAALLKAIKKYRKQIILWSRDTLQ